MASCWLSGSVGRDAYDVIQRMPKSMRFFDMGFGASEGKFNLPMKLGNPIGAAAIFSVFFEFIPLEGGDPCCIWEVENGKYYEMLVTTYSGLYRYNMLDVVRFDGVVGNTPKFVFVAKVPSVLNGIIKLFMAMNLLMWCMLLKNVRISSLILCKY